MVKLKAPGLSMEASGSLGGILTFSKWKGRPYARKLVKPTDPKSEGQIAMRTILAGLVANWQGMSAPNKANWEDLAEQTQTSPFNAFASHNLNRWREFKAPAHDPANVGNNTGATGGSLTAAAAGRRAILTVDLGDTNSNSFALIFRNTGGAVTPAWDNLTLIHGNYNAETIYLTDGPLDPGTYYYAAAYGDGQGTMTLGTPTTDDVTIS